MKDGITTRLCLGLFLAALSLPARAQDGGVTTPAGNEPEAASADAIAKELANPAGSLASLKNNFEYRLYEGDLPDARDQDGWTYSFQPVLPFPVGDQGRRIIFRPLIPVKLDEPSGFDPLARDFETDGPELGDLSFDLVYAGNETGGPSKGWLWGVGAAGTLPTGTGDFGGDQWRLGPELFGGITGEWGIVGGLVSHQWEVGGSNDANYSATAFNYFYAFGLGNGWQLASSPIITHDWKADGGEAWAVPIGVGLAKTTVLGSTPLKVQFEVQKYLVQPDSFGPDWLFKLTITPVIENPFLF